MSHEEILRALSAARTHRLRAELEARLFGALTLEMKKKAYEQAKGRDASRVLRALYPEHVDASASPRALLHNAGEAADPLWRVVDEEGIAVCTAERLLREARARSLKNASDLAVEIEEGIEAWKNRSVLSRTPDGRLFRRRVDVRVPNRQDAIGVIRTAAEAYVVGYAAQVDRSTARSLVAEAMADVEAALALLEEKVRKARVAEAKERDDGGRVPLRIVREACELLAMPGPSAYGRPIDLLEVRKRYRALARRYHPDVSGSADTRGLFEAAVAAYRTIEEYARAVAPQDKRPARAEKEPARAEQETGT